MKDDADRLARRIAAGDRSPSTAARYAAAAGAAPANAIHLALMHSESRSWTGIGWTEREAKAALLERWLDHVGAEGDGGGDDGVPRTLEELDDYYGIDVVRRTVGKGYVDGEHDDDRRSHLRPGSWR